MFLKLPGNPALSSVRLDNVPIRASKPIAAALSVSGDRIQE
jgi:hypothetical protein